VDSIRKWLIELIIQEHQIQDPIMANNRLLKQAHQVDYARHSKLIIGLLLQTAHFRSQERYQIPLSWELLNTLGRVEQLLDIGGELLKLDFLVLPF